jgi:L-histidine Nalpha-methyltransferase
MTDAAAVAPPEVLEEIREGLARDQKALPPKYFYDERGSHLFEEITRLPEYYLTRAERALLHRHLPAWVAEQRPATLVELGAGSAEKTRIILEAMMDAAATAVYVPVDVSEEFLVRTAERPPRRLSGSDGHARSRGHDAGARAARRGIPGPVLHALLGSTIGNFAPREAVALLARVRASMREGDRFLLGVDLRKPPEAIEAAYNDAAGVTAEFNRNMLRVLNAITGADFEPEAFRHHAFYNADEHCIEMHLVSRQAQEVSIPGLDVVTFRAGESLRTEISCKHDRQSVQALFDAASLRLEHWSPDEEGRYAIALAVPA